MRSLIFFHHQFPVHYNSQSRLLWQLHISVIKCKIIPIMHIIQNTFPHIIMDSYTLLLNHCIITYRIHLQTRRQCNRPKRTVRGKCHIMGFCHGRYLFYLCQPASM